MLQRQPARSILITIIGYCNSNVLLYGPETCKMTNEQANELSITISSIGTAHDCTISLPGSCACIPTATQGIIANSAAQSSHGTTITQLAGEESVRLGNGSCW